MGQVVQKEGRSLLYAIKHAESNAELKGLDADSLVHKCIQVSKAPKMQFVGGLSPPCLSLPH